MFSSDLTNLINFLGLSCFFSKLKEKTGMVKETWGLLGSAINVQMSMEDMQKRQEKGDIDEEELKEMEKDMSGKVSRKRYEEMLMKGETKLVSRAKTTDLNLQI